MPSCVYCGFQSEDEVELGYHHYKHHIFTKQKNLPCPVCQFYSEDVVAHFRTMHKERCIYCADFRSAFPHTSCKIILRNGKRNYCYFSIFNQLDPELI
jgi:hypothetical protein